MPVIVDSEIDTVTSLLRTLPAGAHGVDSPDRLAAWLGQHPDEYVVVLGPHVDLFEAIAVCEDLRVARPTVSVVLVRAELSTQLMSTFMHAGARAVVPLDDPPSLDAAVERAYELHVALRGPTGAAQRAKMITVWSPKGGVGKTTVAVNLALALAERGARKVCLVDLDLAFGDVAITMQLFPSHSIEHAIGAERSLDVEHLDALLTRHEDSIMVLAAPSHPDVRDRISPQLVSIVLQTLRASFDYVVVDTAPAFDEQTLTALDETDEVVLVATLDVPTLKNVKVALETLETLDIARNHRHLLLNRADDEVGISPDQVEGILGMAVTTRVATSIDIAAATNSGQPIVVRDPTHPSSLAFLDLAGRMAGESVAPPAPRSPAPVEAAAPSKPAGRRLRKRR